MRSQVRGLPVAPLTGVLDLRSNVDQMPPGALRMRQNLQTIGQNKLARGEGWQKLLSTGAYNNQDAHDQLLTFESGGIRKPITMLFQAELPEGPRFLFRGTQSQIAVLNEYSGNWRLLGTGYGGKASTSAAAPRFHAAQVDAYVAFTNDFDPPMYHVLDSGVDQPLNTFPDLALIGVTRVGVMWAFRGVLFLADIEMDGQRYPNMILWSDYQNPTSFDPAVISSITGQKFLNPGERILGALPFGNSVIIYTTENIWSMVVVGGEQSFDFAVTYSGDKNRSVGLLKYKNTLVSVGDEHAYLAEDGLYTYSPYYLKPVRVEWAHFSTPAIYDNLDTSLCDVPVAYFHDYELLVSVPRVGAANDCPDITLRFNTAYRVADVVDYGFTAFTNYQSFVSPTIRDFAIEYGICDLASWEADYPMGSEGLPVSPVQPVVGFTPTCFFTHATQTINGVTVEDWNQASAASDSLCAALGDFSLDDICRKCAGDSLLIGASSQDWCLKSLGDVYYRERCTNPSAVGSTGSTGYTSSIGSYLLDGYDSILRPGPLFAVGQEGDPLTECTAAKLDFEATATAQPASVGLRIGVSAQPTDPNGTDMLWFSHSSKLLKLLTGKTPAQHAADGTIPNTPARWNFLREGRFLCAELKISGTGGQCVLTRLTLDAKLKESHNS